MFTFLKKLDPQIDYIGQEFSLRLMYFILLVGYTFSFILGVVTKDLAYTLVLGIGTVIFAFIATVPGWPYFRRNPVQFKKAKRE